jgi:hypothetical protein
MRGIVARRRVHAVERPLPHQNFHQDFLLPSSPSLSDISTDSVDALLLKTKVLTVARLGRSRGGNKIDSTFRFYPLTTCPARSHARVILDESAQ